MSFIWKLNVVYGEEPANAVKELTGKSGDINKGFGGEFVWLVPAVTTVAGAGATSFQIVVQEPAFPGMLDLAKGAGGNFRYVFAWPNPNLKPITEVMLFRSSDPIGHPPKGWDQITGDINQGRGGEFLYIISRTHA